MSLTAPSPGEGGELNFLKIEQNDKRKSNGKETIYLAHRKGEKSRTPSDAGRIVSD